jgi:hypothetical protein
MERDRAARDSRIEDAAAAVFAALASRMDAERATAAADERVAHGLRRLLDEGLTTQQAAHLCDLTVGAAQKLLRHHAATRSTAEQPRARRAESDNRARGRGDVGADAGASEGRAMAMADEATAQVHLRGILQLIDRAVRALVDDESSTAVACESQARAAQEALQRVVADPSTPVAVRTSLPRARTLDVHDDAVFLLAAAERQLAALPAEARNKLPVCAAATYLRRARRALATP